MDGRASNDFATNKWLCVFTGNPNISRRHLSKYSKQYENDTELQEGSSPLLTLLSNSSDLHLSLESLTLDENFNMKENKDNQEMFSGNNHRQFNQETDLTYTDDVIDSFIEEHEGSNTA